MRIIYVPLEEIESRYTRMFNWCIEPHVDRIVFPENGKSYEISVGQFLDVYETIDFKARQISAISKLFQDGEVGDGDVFLFADIFFPGIEAIKYMSELSGIKVHVFGFNHAGRADRTDFVKKLNSWSDSAELSWHELASGVFVGSHHHADNVYQKFLNACPIYVTGMPFSREWIDRECPIKEKKEDFVIWPHRICDEKGYVNLLNYASKTNKKIVITSSTRGLNVKPSAKNIEYVPNLSKKEYYKIFSKARWYLSTAYQETFGYTLYEAMHFDCEIAVPRRACYPNSVPAPNLYDKDEEIDYTYRKIESDEYLDWAEYSVFRMVNAIRTFL